MTDIQTQNDKKLFVGNLPFTMQEADITELFSQYGTIVEVRLIVDKFSGRSKGFAFVEFSTVEEAQAAVDALNGYEVDGRAIVVNIARPPRPREDRRGGGNYGGGYDRNDRNDRGGSSRRY